MAIIAMNREMGSLGKDVAHMVGEALGLKVTHHEIVDSLADKMRLRKSHVISYLHGKQSFFERITTDEASMHIHTTDEIFSLAEVTPGIVLRGWGATALLRQVPHAICVRVCAPRELRATRMMERLDTDDRDRVLAEIANNDEAHGAIMRRHFNADASDANHYDLVFNTERIVIQQCVDEILRLAKSAQFAETEDSIRLLHNLTLGSRVRAALRRDERTRECRISVDANEGNVVLAGIVARHDEIGFCQMVAAGLPGVNAVTSVLTAMDNTRRPRGGSI